ncbi:RpiB/LacA/LacB family sugar-phosphate isomerase [Proteus hauseri]|uniref:RpiB/LacA/LacB family sugar-phosphate isomerase n=1 Tax=Proteus cibi TaxID=2050966 RepID=A0ABU6EEX0_9GAMM|nr:MULTISPECIES: RpiB/LacA/LacB family sugar-phosphate isomerase [Proteus]EST57688.1 ribose 5-phosphate isomerase [Proteus hauseri ZMd44]MBG6030134.1 RpiB/LacA/LacB family sugar-phosphate isomerase [Proteus hauseri]MBS6210198.1 RpiB/LacA/LacB family sugar-phosphate isomerase [Proteus hauseri]MEB6857220.1 RpiB/LacA/LacB family sugar-phosphate isomerase [Proteus cibi]MEB7088739.1 RpiB/LacA/LacB family sugar-phosphate isomerase [Proteus cibi]
MENRMIIMGADPSGFELKNTIKSYLSGKHYTIKDLTESAPIGYCDVGDKVGAIISEHPEYIGFVFCGTGMGVSISANKHKNVYCGVCESVTSARFCKIINNCNILAMGGLLITPFKAQMMVDAYLSATFTEGFSEAAPENLQSGLNSMKKIEKKIYKN